MYFTFVFDYFGDKLKTNVLCFYNFRFQPTLTNRRLSEISDLLLGNRQYSISQVLLTENMSLVFLIDLLVSNF